MEQPITADVDIAGAQPEQVPEAPTLVQTSASALLALAPKVFKTTAQMSGLCVVLAGWIEREKLYTAEGFASMKEYAQKELGVAKSAYKKLHQAGEAVWKFYPELAEARWRRGGLPPRVGGWCLGRRTVAGITLGRTVFLSDAAALAPALLLHESAHVEQFGRGRAFAVQYVWESLRHGYPRNPFELEADAYAARILAERPPASAPQADRLT